MGTVKRTILKSLTEAGDVHGIIGFLCPGVVEPLALLKIETLIEDLGLNNRITPERTDEGIKFARRVILVDNGKFGTTTYSFLPDVDDSVTRGETTRITREDILCPLRRLVGWIEEQANEFQVMAIELADDEGFPLRLRHNKFSVIALQDDTTVEGYTLKGKEKLYFPAPGDQEELAQGDLIHIDVPYNDWEIGFPNCLIFHLSRK
jgi:hypothetical protein